MDDRELDALVAEKVTLWTPIPHEDGWQSPDGSHKHWPGPPEYSSSIKDAMEVVEKMRERGLYVVMQADGRREWAVWCTQEIFRDKSLPRAICLAALAAVNGHSD